MENFSFFFFESIQISLKSCDNRSKSQISFPELLWMISIKDHGYMVIYIFLRTRCFCLFVCFEIRFFIREIRFWLELFRRLFANIYHGGGGREEQPRTTQHTPCLLSFWGPRLALQMGVSTWILAESCSWVPKCTFFKTKIQSTI